MSMVAIIAISLVLGVAAGGMVWFGWDLVQNMIPLLHLPKAPSAVKPPEPPSA